MRMRIFANSCAARRASGTGCGAGSRAATTSMTPSGQSRSGTDGVHPSSYGGRQLYRAIPPVETIRPVRERVGGRCAIVVDSGIRHGANTLGRVS
jgi:hypothetical protein